MTNRYPGKCDRCGAMVAATTGTLHRVNDRWAARHNRCAAVGSAYGSDQEAARGIGSLDHDPLEHAYDHVMNEGGDGYNPYRQERDMAELAAAQREQGCPRCRKTPQRHSQLWEECDHCGHEPVYV